MHIMNATLSSGGCLEIMPGFDLGLLLDRSAAGQVTKLYAVPTIYVRLLSVENIKEKLGAVRYCFFSCSFDGRGSRRRQWKDKTGLDIYEAYGMTESSSIVTYNHYYQHVAGSVGTPAGTTEVEIRDLSGQPVPPGEEGEICIRGRNIMQGYLNRPRGDPGTLSGMDWYRSGDIGIIDENGYLFIIDRLKDLIITGGENVYPREIEEILYTMPEIEECAVIGLPDREWGREGDRDPRADPGQPD